MPHITPRKPQQQQRNLTPLGYLVEDILKNILDVKLVTLPEIIQEDPDGVKPQWYRDDYFCAFHHQRGYATNKCQHLRSIIQILINDGQVSIGSPQAQPNRNLRVYQNPLPRHDANINQVSTMTSTSR